MSKKLFNRDFKQTDKHYIFSYNLYVMTTGGDPQDSIISDMKKYDGFMVYPYDADDRLYGMADMCGHLILPQWCYTETPKFDRLRQRRGRMRRVMRNRHPRPIRSTTSV